MYIRLGPTGQKGNWKDWKSPISSGYCEPSQQNLPLQRYILKCVGSLLGWVRRRLICKEVLGLLTVKNWNWQKLTVGNRAQIQNSNTGKQNIKRPISQITALVTYLFLDTFTKMTTVGWMVTFNKHLNHYNHNNHVCSNVYPSLNMTVIRYGTLVLRELTVLSNLILNILL